MAPLPPVLQSPDSALIKACLGPIALGNKALTQAQIEKFWSTDRARLVTCVKRHKALSDFIKDRDSRLSGAVK